MTKPKGLSRFNILPCPMEGAAAHLRDEGVQFKFRWRVICSACALSTAAYRTPELAASAWNVRGGELKEFIERFK